MKRASYQKEKKDIPEGVCYVTELVKCPLKAYLQPLKSIQLNPKLKPFKNTFNPLRKCKNCGTEAWTVEELENFTKNQKLFYGRENLCKQCKNKNKHRGNTT